MKTKNKNIETPTTRKEWRKTKQRAARARKKEAKKVAAEKQASEPKRYDLLAQYHTTLSNSVRNIIEKNHIKYAILTDSYFVISNLNDGACKEIEDAFAGCEHDCGVNRKPHKVRFARWKSKTIIVEEKRQKKPTNNTEEIRNAAHKARKARNIQKYTSRKKHSLGRKAKIAAFRAKKNSGNKVTPAKKETTLQKKLRQRAQKAASYLIRQEKKQQSKPSNKAGSKKTKQLKLNFAA